MIDGAKCRAIQKTRHCDTLEQDNYQLVANISENILTLGFPNQSQKWILLATWNAESFLFFANRNEE